MGKEGRRRTMARGKKTWAPCLTGAAVRHCEMLASPERRLTKGFRFPARERVNSTTPTAPVRHRSPLPEARLQTVERGGAPRGQVSRSTRPSAARGKQDRKSGARQT